MLFRQFIQMETHTHSHTQNKRVKNKKQQIIETCKTIPTNTYVLKVTGIIEDTNQAIQDTQEHQDKKIYMHYACMHMYIYTNYCIQSLKINMKMKY